MFANYHTHTSRCHHAFGEDEEYVRAAIDRGVSVLGFSDHAPMEYGEYVSYYKMLPSELEEYVDSVLRLKEKYKDKIDIKLGLEIEYYPSLWEKSLSLYSRFPIEYLILGQHFVGEEYGDGRDPGPSPSSSTERLTRYTDRVICAMRTGKISCVAHPDIINYTGGDIDFYRAEMGRLITCANRLGIPLEYNLLGMSEGRCYPRAEFWQEAARLGARAVIGCDAHSPDRVAKEDELERARNFLGSLNIEVADELAFKKIF